MNFLVRQLNGKLLYIFYGDNNIIANKCKKFKNVDPSDIVSTINGYFGKDTGPLVWVFSASFGERPASSDLDKGLGFAMFCEANSFPKKPDEFVEVIKGMVFRKN